MRRPISQFDERRKDDVACRSALHPSKVDSGFLEEAVNGPRREGETVEEHHQNGALRSHRKGRDYRQDGAQPALHSYTEQANNIQATARACVMSKIPGIAVTPGRRREVLQPPHSAHRAQQRANCGSGRRSERRYPRTMDAMNRLVREDREKHKRLQREKEEREKEKREQERIDSKLQRQSRKWRTKARNSIESIRRGTGSRPDVLLATLRAKKKREAEEAQTAEDHASLASSSSFSASSLRGSVQERREREEAGDEGIRRLLGRRGWFKRNGCTQRR